MTHSTQAPPSKRPCGHDLVPDSCWECATEEAGRKLIELRLKLKRAEELYETSHASRVHADGAVLRLERERDQARGEADSYYCSLQAREKDVEDLKGRLEAASSIVRVAHARQGPCVCPICIPAE